MHYITNDANAFEGKAVNANIYFNSLNAIVAII